MGRKRNHAKLEMLFAPGVSSNLFKSARAHLQLGKFLGSKMGNLLECSRAAATEADGGVVNINGSRAGVQAGGVVVDAPRTVAVGIARLDVSDIQNLRAVLPESDVPVLFARAFIECVNATPLPFRNVLDGLAVRVFGIFVIQVEIHSSIRTIANVQSNEGIADIGALRFPLENVPPGRIAIRDVALGKVKPDAVIKFWMLFRLEPAKQAGSARRKLLGTLSIYKELGRVEAAMGKADRVHSGDGKAAVENASPGVGAAGDIRDTPLREIAGLHVC